MERVRPRLSDLNDDGDDDFAEYAQGFTPAASVTRASAPQVGTSTSASSSKPKSRFAQRREAERQSGFQQDVPPGDNARFQLDLDADSSTPTPITQRQPSHLGNGVLKDIKEKRVTTVDFSARPAQSNGFPTARRRPPKTANPSNSRPTSNHLTLADNLSDPQNQSNHIHESSTVSEAHVLAEIDAENQQKLQAMSEEEILKEQKELLEMLGEDMASFLKKRGNIAQPRPLLAEPVDGSTCDAEAIHTSTLTKSPGKAVRFNENVSYSNPPSRSPSPQPARRIIPLPAPPTSSETRTASIHDKSSRDEDDPESIREKYFPLEPLNSKLDWMKGSYADDPSGEVADEGTVSQLRFSLSGELQSSTGIYKTSEGNRHAGSGDALTFVELLDLSKSAVTGQRVLAFQILLKIFSRYKEEGTEAFGLITQSDTVTAVVTCCARGMVDKSMGVITVAIALLQEYASLGRTRANTTAAILTVRPSIFESFSYLLSSRFELPYLSALACLETLLALLGTQEDFVSAEMVECPYLLENMAQHFLQMPWPPASGSHDPEPRVGTLFSLIISRSRANAESLITRRLEHSTLRYIAVQPWLVSPDKMNLAFELGSTTLQILVEYGRYGLGCSACTTSSALFRAIEEYLEDHPMTHPMFTKAWLDLLEVWASCAIDPHSTTPEHDIVWPEVKDWGSHLITVLPKLREEEGEYLPLARRLISALVAWLEGSLKHDKTAYEELVARLEKDSTDALGQLLRVSLEEPVTAEKAKTMLVLKSLVGLTKLDLGGEADILNHIHLESTSDEKEDVEGKWIT